jgi:hypothetical protein
VALLAVSVFVSAPRTALRVEGDRTLWLPWSLVARLPVFDNVAAGPLRRLTPRSQRRVIVALWTASTRGWAAIVRRPLAMRGASARSLAPGLPQRSAALAVLHRGGVT